MRKMKKMIWKWIWYRDEKKMKKLREDEGRKEENKVKLK